MTPVEQTRLDAHLALILPPVEQRWLEMLYTRLDLVHRDESVFDWYEYPD